MLAQRLDRALTKEPRRGNLELGARRAHCRLHLRRRRLEPHGEHPISVGRAQRHQQPLAGLDERLPTERVPAHIETAVGGDAVPDEHVARLHDLGSEEPEFLHRDPAGHGLLHLVQVLIHQRENGRSLLVLANHRHTHRRHRSGLMPPGDKPGQDKGPRQQQHPWWSSARRARCCSERCVGCMCCLIRGLRTKQEAIMGETTPRIDARLFTRPNPAPNRIKRVLCVVVSVIGSVPFGDRTDTPPIWVCIPSNRYMYLVMYRYVF